MKKSKFTRRMIRPARDFILGLGLFAAVAAPNFFGHGQMSPAWAGATPEQLVLGSPDQQIMLAIVMGLVFASLLSLNLWFARHLRRAYASPRRR